MQGGRYRIEPAGVERMTAANPAHRKPDAPRAIVGELDGDVGGRIACADDQYVSATVGPSVGEVPGMNDLSAEPTDSRPGRSGGCAVVARGQDDCRWSPMLVQKVDYLFQQLDASADFAPTTQQIAVQEELKQRGDKAAQDFQQLAAKDLPAFNGMLREHNIGNIYLKTP